MAARDPTQGRMRTAAGAAPRRLHLRVPLDCGARTYDLSRVCPLAALAEPRRPLALYQLMKLIGFVRVICPPPGVH